MSGDEPQDNLSPESTAETGMNDAPIPMPSSVREEVIDLLAKIIRREWTSKGPLGKRVRHVAFGYTLAINGQRERKVSSDWRTETDALAALNQRMQAVQSGDLTQRPEISLDALTTRYL